MRWIPIALLFMACRDRHWDPKVATSLQIAGLTVSIPEGWRAMSERADGTYKLAASTVGMAPELDREGIATATILITLDAQAPR